MWVHILLYHSYVILTSASKEAQSSHLNKRTTPDYVFQSSCKGKMRQYMWNFFVNTKQM